MFMGNSELNNTKNLLKIRMRECRGIHTICSLIVIEFLCNVASIMSEVFKYQDGITQLTSNVFSSWALGLSLIACFYYAFQYGEYNANHQIFPQTRVSRFLSYELYCYLTLLITQILALGLYFIQYLLCSILNQMKGNIELAYTFNLPFIVAGFFVTLLYGCLLISFINLVGTIVRKFRWQALIIYAGIFLLLWIVREHNVIQNMISFYFKEASLFLFIIKIIVSLIILEVLNHAINLHTSVIAERKFYYHDIIIASVILFSFLIGMLASFSSNSYSDNTIFTQEHNIDPAMTEPTLIIDASHLAPNTILTVDGVDELASQNNLLYGDPFYNNTDNQILIYYIPERSVSNWVNLTEFTNPKLEVTLSGNRLNINVIEDKNIKVLSFYPYSTLTQFDSLRNKAYAKISLGNMAGSSQGMINITTPESKHFSFESPN